MQARATLGWWHREPKPNIVGKLWFISGESQPSQRAEALVVERLKSILEARAAKRPEPPLLYPEYRGKEDNWVEPPKSYQQRIRRDATALGIVPTPTIMLEHFQWTIEFHCGGQDPLQAGERIKVIAGRARVHPRAVEKAVNHVLGLIGLDRRQEPRGPITKKQISPSPPASHTKTS